MTAYTEGPYRRRIRLVTIEPGVIDAALEDDFHHFAVTLRHDDARVVEVAGRPVRWPWSSCADAVVPLRQLEGMALSRRCTAVAMSADPRANCTHLFDLAGLAVAHAARGMGRRQYDAEIPRPVGGRSRARLWRDGALLLDWQLVEGAVVDAPPYSDVRWNGGFMRWADSTLDPDVAEAAIVLRRACTIGSGRGMDLDVFDGAGDLEHLMSGVCFTMQPERIHAALRVKGSVRDFADRPEALLGDETEPSPSREG
jgi:hypothetical protein